MKKQPFFLNILLTVILSIVLLTAMLLRTFAPTLILPPPDIPNMVLLSLTALLIHHYLAPDDRRRCVGIPLLSMLTFGLLPWAACFADGVQAVKLGLIGGAVFTVTARLFCSLLDRISSGPARRAAPALSAFGLYLAAQGFLGLMP